MRLIAEELTDATSSSGRDFEIQPLLGMGGLRHGGTAGDSANIHHALIVSEV